MKCNTLLRYLLPLPILLANACGFYLEPRQIDITNEADFPVECVVIWVDVGEREVDFPQGVIQPGETATQPLARMEQLDEHSEEHMPHFVVSCTSLEECDDPDSEDGYCGVETRESAGEKLEPTDCWVVGTLEDPGVECKSLSDKKNDFNSEHG